MVLHEELGTRYITPYITPKLQKLLGECKDSYLRTGDKVTLDIAYCKFNPDNHFLVCSYSEFIDFVDSNNVYIDRILDHNSRVHIFQDMEKNGSMVVERVPSDFSIQEILHYIQHLDTSKTYRLPSNEELNGKVPTVSILIAMSILVLYPYISIDLGEQTFQFFTTFDRLWNYSGFIHRNSYNVLWSGNNILRVVSVGTNRHGENIFYIPGIGEIDEGSLNQQFEIIPYEFGTLPRSELEQDPEFEGIFERIAKEIQLLTNTKKKKNLLSELTMNERGDGVGSIETS